MRRATWLVFGLALVLSGPLLRQAEAADDLIRSLHALRDPGQTLAEVDGGVGDDKGEMTPKAHAGHDPAPAEGSPRDLWDANSCLDLLTLDPSLLARPHAAPRPGQVPWPPDGAAARLAWLQVFLI
jgi:hypothetical protein